MQRRRLNRAGRRFYQLAIVAGAVGVGVLAGAMAGGGARIRFRQPADGVQVAMLGGGQPEGQQQQGDKMEGGPDHAGH